MSNTESPGLLRPPFLEKRPLGEIFKDSLRFYLKHFFPFTQVLLLPLLYQFIGIYGSLFASYAAMDYLMTHHSNLIMGQPLLLLAIVIPISLIFITLFCKGFWEYLVYFASLNINSAEVIHGQTPDFKKAYQTITDKTWPYLYLLKLLIVVQVFPFLVFLAFLCLGLWFFEMPLLWITTAIFGTFLTVVLSIVAIIALIFFSLAFQILAFEPVNNNPLETVMRSFRLVQTHFWKTSALFMVVFVATSYLIPELFLALCQALKLYNYDGINDALVRMIMENLQPQPALGPLYASAYESALQLEPYISWSVTKIMLSLLVTGLLLPLGTFHFALLYGDLKARLAEQTAQPPTNLPETKPQASAG